MRPQVCQRVGEPAGEAHSPDSSSYRVRDILARRTRFNLYKNAGVRRKARDSYRAPRFRLPRRLLHTSELTHPRDSPRSFIRTSRALERRTCRHARAAVGHDRLEPRVARARFFDALRALARAFGPAIRSRGFSPRAVGVRRQPLDRNLDHGEVPERGRADGHRPAARYRDASTSACERANRARRRQSPRGGARPRGSPRAPRRLAFRRRA